MNKKITIEATTRRLIAGTEWPVIATIERDDHTGRPWLLVTGICNGTAERVYRCRTKGIALDLAHAWKAEEDGGEVALSEVLHSYGERDAVEVR